MAKFNLGVRDLFFFFFWPWRTACRILVLRPGIKPVPPSVEVQNPNHWTATESRRNLIRSFLTPGVHSSVAVVLVIQSCLTLCNPTDCSPPGSLVYGILQARILEWIIITFSRGSSWPRDWTWVSCIAGRFFTIWATGKTCWCPQAILSIPFSCSVVSNSLRPHGLQHASLPCPSPTLRACSNSFPLSRWCHPTVSSSVVPFSPPSILPNVRVFSKESVLHNR